MPLVMVPACAKAADGRANTKKTVAAARLHVMREIPLYPKRGSSTLRRPGHCKGASLGQMRAFGQNPLPAPKCSRLGALEERAWVPFQKEARAAYGKLMDFLTQPMGAWATSPGSAEMGGFRAVQERAIAFAKANAERSFALAS